MRTQALYVVAKLGVADFLRRGPVRIDEIARDVGANPKALFRVMKYLASHGVFSEHDSESFGLTPLGELLRSDSPESLRDLVIVTGEEHYRAAGELLHTVRTGETAFNHLYHQGFFQYLAEHPEAGASFNKAMSQTASRLQNPVESYDYAGKSTVIDVGGGHGELIATVLRANPKLKGILFDLPQGLGGVESLLEAKGVANRCKIIPGSFFDSVPAGGDVYILSRVLHDFPDDKAKMILTNCRKSMAEDCTLLIREDALPERGAEPPAAHLDLVMLSMFGGEERTEAEWRSLLQPAGFVVARVHRKQGQLDLIEAKPIKLC
jgi:hypothetical protein